MRGFKLQEPTQVDLGHGTQPTTMWVVRVEGVMSVVVGTVDNGSRLSSTYQRFDKVRYENRIACCHVVNAYPFVAQ